MEGASIQNIQNFPWRKQQNPVGYPSSMACFASLLSLKQA